MPGCTVSTFEANRESHQSRGSFYHSVFPGRIWSIDQTYAPFLWSCHDRRWILLRGKTSESLLEMDRFVVWSIRIAARCPGMDKLDTIRRTMGVWTRSQYPEFAGVSLHDSF